jgi:DNA-3-methyladenine glycosylase II
MKACYFSRQKTGYARDLADSLLSERLNLADLEKLSDNEVKAILMQVKGIGDWTADVYLLMVMCRADVMPRGDLALHAAFQKLNNLDNRPKSDEFLEIAKRWKPYRSVAARLLWHYYLSAE